MPELRRAVWNAVDRGAMPWTIVAFPTPGWANQVFGQPDVARLWDAIRATVRLDEPDPVAAWREHLGVLQARAAQLNERRFDAVRFRGPGTDLAVGLLPAVAGWRPAAETAKGQFSCRTFQPRRSSRARTAGGPRVTCGRRSRSSCPAGRSSATWR